MKEWRIWGVRIEYYDNMHSNICRAVEFVKSVQLPWKMATSGVKSINVYVLYTIVYVDYVVKCSKGLMLLVLIYNYNPKFFFVLDICVFLTYVWILSLNSVDIKYGKRLTFLRRTTHRCVIKAITVHVVSERHVFKTC